MDKGSLACESCLNMPADPSRLQEAKVIVMRMIVSSIARVFFMRVSYWRYVTERVMGMNPAMALSALREGS